MVLECEEFQHEATLEDCTPKPEFLTRVREIVAQQKNAEIAEDFVNFFFG